MFTRRLGNFVYIVKITHNKECQLSGPFARVLISSQRCKINQKFLNNQTKPCKIHVNNNMVYIKQWYMSYLGGIYTLFNSTVKKIETINLSLLIVCVEIINTVYSPNNSFS